MKVQVHQAVAFQRYGERIFEEGIVCRHQNNDKTDFRPDNLLLGTSMDNHLDNPPEMIDRFTAQARACAKLRRIFSDQEVRDIREAHRQKAGTVALAKRYGVAKATISYMVSRRTYRDVV